MCLDLLGHVFLVSAQTAGASGANDIGHWPYSGGGLMSIKYLEEAGNAFQFAAKPVRYERCDTGHINNTFFVDCGVGNPKYILQRVNTDIFKKCRWSLCPILKA